MGPTSPQPHHAADFMAAWVAVIEQVNPGSRRPSRPLDGMRASWQGAMHQRSDPTTLEIVYGQIYFGLARESKVDPHRVRAGVRRCVGQLELAERVHLNPNRLSNYRDRVPVFMAR